MPISFIEIKHQRCLPGKMEVQRWDLDVRREKVPSSTRAEFRQRFKRSWSYVAKHWTMPSAVRMSLNATVTRTPYLRGSTSPPSVETVGCPLPALVSFPRPPLSLALPHGCPSCPLVGSLLLLWRCQPISTDNPPATFPCRAVGLTRGFLGPCRACVPECYVACKTGLCDCNPFSKAIRPWKGRKVQLL